MMSNQDWDIDNGNIDEKKEKKSQELTLPTGKEGEYVLECWKVKDGVLVRSGETVALACLKGTNGSSGASETNSLTTSDPSAAKHKRPTRRKRPTAAAPPADTETQATKRTAQAHGSEELKSIKLPPNEISKKNQYQDGDKEEADASEVESKESSESSKKLPHSTPIVAPIAGFVRIGKKGDHPDHVVGFIEPCSHPAVVDGLCGVCGVPMDESSGAEDNDYTTSDGSATAMSQLTVSGGLTFTVSEHEGQQMARQNAQRLRKQRKLSLILDLDHTLVHATADIRARQHLDTKEDVRSLVLPMTEETEQGQQHLWMQHFVKLRPNVKEFLNTVIPLFEVGVYTAGTRQYAEQIAIVLCRHVVGANRDQIDLDQLRYQVSQAEAELKRSQADIEVTKSQKEAETNENIRQGDSGDKKRQHQGEDETGDGDDKDEEPTKKKRKVTFAMESAPSLGPPPETQLQESSVVTPEEVAKLKEELEEADRLERKAIELRQRLFGSRIVSRTDVGDLGRDVKSLKRIFPCGGTMAAVVDDREDVWANAKDNNNDNNSRQGEPPENLLLVRPYHWQPFVGFADINNASGIDLAATETNGKDMAGDAKMECDVQLLWTADILKRLHARYYSSESDEAEEKSVPGLLGEMREEVLHGDNIVLSGLIPLHRQSQDGNYEGPRPTVVRYAECLGAKIQPNVTPAVSFVVAAKDGTDKTLQARKTPGCAVVRASWLMECFWSLTRRDPIPHLLTPLGRDKANQDLNDISNGATHTSTQSRILFDHEDEDSEEDDDDFAADFEKDIM